MNQTYSNPPALSSRNLRSPLRHAVPAFARLISLRHGATKLAIFRFCGVQSFLAGIILSFLLFSSAYGQQYGPPNILVVYGQTDPYIATFSGDGSDPNGNDADVYSDGSVVGSDGTYYDSNGNSWGASFDGGFGGAFFALDSDRTTILGVPPGIIIVLPTAITPSTTPTLSTASVPTFWNGTAYVTTFFTPATYFTVANSPPYHFDGSGPMTISGPASGSAGIWSPESNIFTKSLPQQVYVNGVMYALTMAWGSIDQGDYGEYSFYEPPGTDGPYFGMERDLPNGGGTQGISGLTTDGVSFSGNVDSETLALGGLPDNVAVSFGASGGSAAYGPRMVSWKDNLLQFYYTTSDSKDVYWCPDNGDQTGDYTVIIAQDLSVLAIHNTVSAAGTYSSTAHTFQFTDTTDTPNFWALDAYGNPYPGVLPVGLNIVVSASGNAAQHIQSGGGTVYTPPTYAYRRPDGSWGWKFTSIPDGVYLIQDDNQNYTAPPYAFVSANGDTFVNAIYGWPSTNIYPQYLYVNGIQCPLNQSSEYDSGAGLPRTGGASYYAPQYDLTVVLSWTWDSVNHFQGFVNGSYGQSSAFTGNWNGLTSFTSLTKGAIVSVNPPPTVPTDGNPPQVSVNGSTLSYNSAASAALSAAGTPGDVYTGSLGQTLTIFADGNGTVNFIPGANAPGGFSGGIGGNYNPTTQQFSFNGGGNTIDFGNGNYATITATDLSGHNLGTANGATPSGSGGLTNLNGSLDVQGNTFSLGTWTNGSESLFGLGISYVDANTNGTTSLLGFTTTRSAVNWLWAHPSTDGATDQVNAMQLDSGHRLLLYDPNPANQAAPTVTIDPVNGMSSVVPVRVLPAGDIDMGSFTTGSQPGQ